MVYDHVMHVKGCGCAQFWPSAEKDLHISLRTETGGVYGDFQGAGLAGGPGKVYKPEA